jgi:hypothetical protein
MRKPKLIVYNIINTMAQSKFTIGNLFSVDRLKSRLRQVQKTINGMIQGNLGRPLLKVLLYFPSVLGIKSTIYVVKVLLVFAASVHRLWKASGMRYVVIYLKACHTLLQQAVAGQRLSDTGSLGARVKRTRGGGLPSLIPTQHRAEVRKGNKMIIRLWLSLFSVYRVIDIPGRVKLSTILAPYSGETVILPEFSNFVGKFYQLLKTLYTVPGSITDALYDGALDFMKGLRAKPFLISAASPVLSGKLVKWLSTSPVAILLSVRVWNAEHNAPLKELLRNYCVMTGNIWMLNRMELWAKGPRDVRDKKTTVTSRGEIISGGTDLMEWLPQVGKKVGSTWNQFLGKLGFKKEAAGKVRVFAMVDCFTQWLMEPLHKAIFQALRVIPQDGTHDQVKPLERLIERQRKLRETGERPGVVRSKPLPPRIRPRLRPSTYGLFSFDLSAATDRLPLVFQKVLLSPILSSWGAEVWGSLLVARDYLFARKDELGLRGGSVKYSTGQPMGALSSWAMLALTHHCIVQWAWYRVCRRGHGIWTWYQDYAVLGDDVVILGDLVAREYVKLMTALGVEISMHKSLVSKSGLGLEFAKRTFLRGEDVSAVPLAEVLVARNNMPALMELVRKYRMTLGQYLSFLKFGYRAKGGSTGHLWRISKRLRNYLVAFYSPAMPRSPGLVQWLSMRTIGSFYKVSATKLAALLNQLVQNERKALLELLDRYAPLVAEARRLGTVYRDREHYGTSSRDVTRTYFHPGMSIDVPQDVVDSLNETVYREAFLDTVTDARDLRALVEGLEVGELSTLEDLWDRIAKLRDDLSALPLPRSLHVAAGIKPVSVISSDLGRWNLYSRIFRSTKS